MKFRHQEKTFWRYPEKTKIKKTALKSAISTEESGNVSAKSVGEGDSSIDYEQKEGSLFWTYSANNMNLFPLPYNL